MAEQKNLLINCDVCDTRKMNEEDYSRYEAITLNSDIVVVSEESKAMLNRLPITINSDKVVELPEGVKISATVVNGAYEIKGTKPMQEHMLLTANGSLTIHPGTEEVLEAYEYIVANGSVKCPASLERYLYKMTINGSLDLYPDDCVFLAADFVLDEYFPLRAKENAAYYVENQVMIKNAQVDLKKLCDKNVTFKTKKVIVPAAKVEDCAPLFAEDAEFVVVPEDMTLVMGEVILSEELIKKNGKKLFVCGALTLDEESGERACGMLEKLIVRGRVSILKRQESLFRSVDAEYDELTFRMGREFTGMAKVKLDMPLFEASPDGVSVTRCALVVLSEDIDTQTIFDRLKIKNCAKVTCSEAQESAVTAVSAKVAMIGPDKEKAADGENATGMDAIFGMFGGMKDTKVVNADEYML